MRVMIAILALLLSLNANESFSLKVNKTTAYLNEPIVTTLTLEYNSSNRPRYIKFDEFTQRLVDSKFISKVERNSTNRGFIVYKYLLFIQDTAVKHIATQEIKVAHIEPKTSQIIWKSLHSNSINLNAKPIPNGVGVVGNLNLEVNSTKVKDGVVKLDVALKGAANLEDIKPFTLDIKDATTYANRAKTEYNISDNRLNSTFKQSFTIVANQDFTIPSFEFSYFNSDTQMLEHLKSRAIKVEVKNSKLAKNRWLYFVFGLLSGIALLLFVFYLKRLKKADLPLKKRVKLALSQKELYSILLPFSSEYDLDDILKRLESNIYANSNKRVSKKEIIKAIEQNQQ